jgi:hypothetical protein
MSFGISSMEYPDYQTDMLTIFPTIPFHILKHNHPTCIIVHRHCKKQCTGSEVKLAATKVNNLVSILVTVATNQNYMHENVSG